MKTIEITNGLNFSLEGQILKEMRRKIVVDFLDNIILANLMHSKGLSGYEIIELIHRKFDFMISPGTVYSVLYSMERKELLRGTMNAAKRTFTLTPQGETAIDVVLRSQNETLSFIRSLIENP
jgi:DNA-binding PadR family transcriptional regulator